MTDFNDDISLLIPAYLRGELSTEETRRVEESAAIYPEFQADLEFQRQLRDTLQSGRSSQPSDDLGWARLSKAMDSDEEENRVSFSAPVNDVSPERSKIWMGATAALALLAIGQFGVMATSQANSQEQDKYTLVSKSTAGSQAQIAPPADIRVLDLTDVLKSVGGQIVSGPSALGLFEVKFESKDACRAAVPKLQKISENAMVCR